MKLAFEFETSKTFKISMQQMKYIIQAYINSETTEFLDDNEVPNLTISIASNGDSFIIESKKQS
jgi:hypothetical protein